jgi:hypothetical protein
MCIVSVIILLNTLQIPFACTNAHDSQVWSFDGVDEFWHIPFTGFELFE